MRDGIHKSLKMNHACKKLLRLAMREADWGSPCRQAALDALTANVKDGLSSKFLQNLSKKFNHQGSLINPLGAHEFAEFTSNCSSFEESLANDCAIQYDQGIRGDQVIKLGLEATISSLSKQIERGIITHLLVKGEYGTSLPIKAIKESLNSISVAELSEKIMNKEPLITKRQKQIFDVDVPIFVPKV